MIDNAFTSTLIADRLGDSQAERGEDIDRCEQTLAQMGSVRLEHIVENEQRQPREQHHDHCRSWLSHNRRDQNREENRTSAIEKRDDREQGIVDALK